MTTKHVILLEVTAVHCCGSCLSQTLLCSVTCCFIAIDLLPGDTEEDVYWTDGTEIIFINTASNTVSNKTL